MIDVIELMAISVYFNLYKIRSSFFPFFRFCFFLIVNAELMFVFQYNQLK